MFAVLLGCGAMVIEVGSSFRGMVEGLNVKMTGSSWSLTGTGSTR